LSKSNFISLIAYVVIFIIITNVFLQTLTESVTQLTFPNFQFIITFILMIATSLVIGLLVQRFINKTTNENKVLKTNLIILFVIGTVISLLLLLGAYMLV
jgi:K+-sensing histidine kinase KdpD